MRNALVLATLLIASGVQAATCTLAVNPLPFGTYNSLLVTPTSSQANMTVSCQSGLLELVSYSLALSAGNSGNANARYLLNGSYHLNYNLYQDLLHTRLWGSGTDAYSSTLNITTILTPFSTTLTVYGSIPAGQTSAGAGSYSDTITATLNF